MEASNRRHQQWTTRHPIRFQECADRRPLLQQSCSDLRFPGPQRITRCTAPGAPGSRKPIPWMPWPQVPPSAAPPPTHRFWSSNDHQKLTLLDGRRMVSAWTLVPVRPHHPSWPDGPLVASALTSPRTTRITTHPSTNASQHGRRPSGEHRAAEARSIKDRAFLWRIPAVRCRPEPGNHYDA